MVETLPVPQIREVVQVTAPVVRCDGREGAVTGHPAVYLNVAEEGVVQCPYCSRQYIFAEE